MGLVEHVLHVGIQVMQSSFGDRIRDIVDGTGHVWQSTLLCPCVASLGREFSEKSNLEIVKVLVIARKLPLSSIFEHGFDNEPVLVFGKTVSWYTCFKRCMERSRGFLHMVLLR